MKALSDRRYLVQHASVVDIMGAATERALEVMLEDSLRKRTERSTPEAVDTVKASPRVTPLTQVWKPSERIQNITLWVLLLVTTFFSIAVVVEELQASWYRSPALDPPNSHIYSASEVGCSSRSGRSHPIMKSKDETYRKSIAKACD
jgi:hypothetical protein